MYGNWDNPWPYFAAAVFAVASFVLVVLLLAPLVHRAVDDDDRNEQS